jgi:hypothetical protein
MVVSFRPVVLDAFASLSFMFRPLPTPGNLGFSSLFVGISLTVETKVPLLTTRLGLQSDRTQTYCDLG